MLTENDVVDAVRCCVEAKGYVVKQALSTTEQGIDLVAEHPSRHRRIVVEAKGATSSKHGSSRFGHEFSAAQVRDHVANAVFTAAKLLTSEPRSSVVIALPDNERHRTQLTAARAGISRLAIKVWLVSESRDVSVWDPDC